MSFQIFRLIFLFVCSSASHRERWRWEVNQAARKLSTWPSFILYWDICHFRIRTAVSISAASKAKSQIMKMRAFSPASAASAACPRGSVLFPGFVRSFRSIAHVARASAWILKRWETKTLQTFLPPYRCSPCNFSAPSLMKASLTLIQYWYMTGSKSHQDG